MLQTLSGEYVDVGGIKTYYVKRGSGPAVVMLHGQSQGSTVSVIWGTNIEPIADAGFTVYALDEVGFGKTENAADFSIERRIEHVREFLRVMGLDRVSLWGHSDGSYIACSIALQDPGVERLILMASGSLSPEPPNVDREAQRLAAEERNSYSPSLENARKTLMHSLTNHDVITDELVRDFYETSMGKNYESYLERMKTRKRRIYDDLHALKVPVLMLWGTDDSGGAERGLALFEKIPGAELHLFSNCSHWVQRDQTERVNRLAIDFLRTT